MTVPTKLIVPEIRFEELDVGAALAVGMIRSMLAKRISSTRLFFIKKTLDRRLTGYNISGHDIPVGICV